MPVAAHEQVLQHARVLEELDVLEGSRDSEAGDFRGREAKQVLAREAQVALLRLVDAGDHIEERRLAGTVGADDGEDLAGLDRERDPLQCRDAAEAHSDAVHLQQAHRIRSVFRKLFCRRNMSRRQRGKSST